MVIIEKENFSVSQICSSGQCFRLDPADETGKVYELTAGDRYLKIEVAEDQKKVRFYCTQEEFEQADYKTNLNYKSSGWFFLCNLYKNGKTRKRCKRMNDSAFLNSRRTGIFKDMSNGTICIPKDLRDNNGLEKNDRVELIPMQEGIYIRKAYGEKKCQ